MPYAPAHPAVVLPLQRLGLPLSALVVGAIAPDAPVYLPVGVEYRTTHSALGVLISGVLGLVLLWLWFAVVRDAVVDLTPSLRRRLPVRARLDGRGWLLAPLALLIGTGTHVLWDSATHDWGFVVREVAFLREEYGPLPLYSWLQHTSTLVGSLVVAAYGVVVLRRRPRQPRPPAVRRPDLWLAPILVVPVVVGIVVEDAAPAIGAALFTVLVVAILWHVFHRPAR